MTPLHEQLPSAESLGLARLIHHREVDSTMDVAHELAASGAPAGTLVIADRQTRGRGRGGNTWQSGQPSGVWMTLIERPDEAKAIGVLALRLGMALAASLDRFSPAPIELKWPNDVLSASGKLAGILVEARWRQSAIEWIAIGIGINLRASDEYAHAAALHDDVSRADVLRATIPSIRATTLLRGALSSDELSEWTRRDVALDREIVEPLPGLVRGISTDGALLVEPKGGGPIVSLLSGSLRFA